MKPQINGSAGEPEPASRWPAFLAGAVIALAALAAYYNCLGAPFVFDDRKSVQDNPTIRNLPPIWGALHPPSGGLTVSGRPILNLSFALNYHFGGPRVWGYHAVNLAIHICAALTLFGVARRTFLRPVMRERYGAAALPLGLAVGLLWALHPLQTEAVTYVAQRAESLMGLFYLLTLYCFIRGALGISNFKFHISNLWFVLSIAACFLGMGTKEVMVSAPLMALLYDRTFIAGTFREAMRRRWGLYASFAGSWLVLAWLVAGAGELGSPRAGYNTPIGWWSYALIQAWAIPHYLALSVWPHSLVFEYGRPAAMQWASVLPFALIVALLLAGACVSLARRPEIGFWGCWFFLILAPTSSVMPLAGQAVAEHRMYLPLAAVITLAVMGGYDWLGRGSAAVFLGLAGILGLLSSERNQDYRSTLTIWRDTVAKRPTNERAFNNLGWTLMQSGMVEEAIGPLRKAVEIEPDYALAENNLGNALLQKGSLKEALAHVQKASELDPRNEIYQNDFGNALMQMGRLDESIQHFQKALELKPDLAQTRVNLASVLLRQGREEEAIVHLRKALAIQPDHAEGAANLGSALLDQGRVVEATEYLRKALSLDPGNGTAQYNFGNALLKLGRLDEASMHLRKAVELRPDFAAAHNSLGSLLLQRGQADEAIAHFRKALELEPSNAEAHNNLGWGLAQEGHVDEAIGQFRSALEIQPGYAKARNNLGIVFLKRGEAREAVAEFQRAVEAQPRDAELHNNLGTALLQTGQARAAIEHYRSAIQLGPEVADARNNLAWVLATWPDASMRDGANAITLAREADRLSQGKKAAFIATLAAAYAEAGRFAEAISTAQRAEDAAKAQANASLVELVERQLKDFRAGMPYRENAEILKR